MLTPPDDFESLVELLLRDQVAAMGQQHAFLKAERVDRPESPGGDDGVAKPQLGLHAIGHRGIDIGEPRAKLMGELPNRSFLILGLRRWDSVENRRGGAAEVTSEFTCKAIPQGDGSQLW